MSLTTWGKYPCKCIFFYILTFITYYKLVCIFSIIKQHVQSLACNIFPPRWLFLTKSSRKRQKSRLAWIKLEIKTGGKKGGEGESKLSDIQALMQLYDTPRLKKLRSGEAAWPVSEPRESQGSTTCDCRGEGCSGAVPGLLKSRFSNSTCALGRAGPDLEE